MDICLIAAGLVFFKLAFLNVEMFKIYGREQVSGMNLKLLLNIFLIVSLIISVYWFSPVILVVGLIAFVGAQINNKKICESGQMQWQQAISDENQRMFRVKRFYNLFTDVPGVNSKIKRRKWLDFVFNGIKPVQKNTYLYLFARGFVRNNEYIGLFMRLTIIQTIMLALIDNFYISLIVEMLFIYLVGFQLKPYFKEVMLNMMQRLYPVSGKDKVNDFTKLSVFVLCIQWVISAIAIFYKFGLSVNSLVIIVAGLAVLLFVGYFYMPRQLKKYLDNGAY